MKTALLIILTIIAAPLVFMFIKYSFLHSAAIKRQREEDQKDIAEEYDWENYGQYAGQTDHT